MAEAIKSVEGVKLLLAPKKGSGEMCSTVAVIELSGKAKMSAVVKALEEAKTPHASQCAPGVSGLIPGKVKASVTLEQLQEMLRKADVLEP